MMLSRLLGKLFKFVLVILVLAGIAIAVFDTIRYYREADEAADIAPATGRFIQAADAQIFVQESGSPQDPAVILIHGTGTWGGIWHETITKLADAGFRVITIDLPPFGYSQKLDNPESYSRQKQAARILAVLDALAMDRAILVGHSVGARPTIEAALMSPGRISKLVLVDSALGFPVDPSEPTHFVQNDAPGLQKIFFSTGWLRNAIISAYGTNPLFLGKLLKSFVSNKAAITPERIEIVKKPMTVKGTTNAYGDWLANLTISTDNSLGSDFSQFNNLTMPTLLIWGRTDTITPLWQGQKLQELIPNSTLEIIDNVGHIPYLENVDAFNSKLLNFIR